MHRRFLGAGLAALAGLVALSGCGSAKASTGASPANPTQAVKDAVSADANQSGLQVSLRLVASPSTLTAGGSGLSNARAQDILGTRLVMSVHTTGSETLAKMGTAGDSGELDVSLVKGGTTLAEVREVNKVLYVRVDLAAIASAYGLSTQALGNIRQGLNQAATRLPAASALEAGQWVSLDLASVEQRLGQFGIPATTLSPAQAAQFQSRLARAAEGAYQVSKGSSAGSYVIALQDQKLVEQELAVLQTLPGASSLPGIANIGSMLRTKVPASMVTRVDATVSGGQLTQLGLPLNQFDTHHQMPGPVQIVAALSAAGPVSKPSTSTPVDLNKVFQLFQQVRGTTSATAS